MRSFAALPAQIFRFSSRDGEFGELKCAFGFGAGGDAFCVLHLQLWRGIVAMEGVEMVYPEGFFFFHDDV